MAGYKSDFGGNVDYAYGRGTRDIAGTLQKGMSSLSNTTSAIGQAAAGVRDLSKQIESLKVAQTVAQSIQQFELLQKNIDEASRKMKQIPFDVLEKGIGRVVKGLISFNTSILTIGFDFLIDSIKRVYELQERWTKAIGGFNMKIGGTSAGLGKMTKAAVQLSGQLRGLTDGDISEAIDGFAEFNDALGSTTDKSVKFAKTSLELSRGFNLGWTGAGKLTKTFTAMGDDVDDVNEVMKDLVKGANASGVSTNLVAKDVEQASTYMARFGKENQKTFVQGAAFARKFGISISEVQKSMEGLDMFDEAAKTASKLNTAFGTMINSMDLMMEDDPVKRLEMIRQQFLAQGTTFDKLTPKQRRFFTETMHLTEEQTAALLDANHANESYADMQAEAAKKEKAELSAKQLMEKQLRATAQTMFAFGAAFDKVTVAIANAIKPLLQVLGLASDGDKKFTGFGEVMTNVTNTVVDFFNSLAKNARWQSFMKELAKDLLSAGHALKEFVLSGGAADLVGDIAEGMKSFYVTVRDLAVKAVPLLHPLLDVFLMLSSHIKELVVAWGAMKGLGMIGSMSGQGGGAFGGLTSMLGGGPQSGKGSGRNVAAGMAGNMMMGAGVGGAIGGVGGAAGGAIGGVFGPLGALLGAGLGTLFQNAFDYFTKDDELAESHEKLAKAMQMAADSAKQHSQTLTDISLHQREIDLKRSTGDEALIDIQKGKKYAEIEDKQALIDRIGQLQQFGKTGAEFAIILRDLSTKGTLTKQSLAMLMGEENRYADSVKALQKVTAGLLEQEERKLGFVGDQLKVDKLKNEMSKNDYELEQLRQHKAGFGAQIQKSLSGDLTDKEKTQLLEDMNKTDEEIKAHELKHDKQAMDLQKAQNDISDKHYKLDLKRAEIEYLAKDEAFVKYASEHNKLDPESNMVGYFTAHPDALRRFGQFAGGENLGALGLADSPKAYSRTNSVQALPVTAGFTAPTNYAGGSDGGSTTIKGGDVYLDGRLVGEVLAPHVTKATAKAVVRSR